MNDNPYSGIEKGLATVNREIIRWNRPEMQWKKNQISKIVKELLSHMKSISPFFHLLNPKIYFSGGSYEGLSVGDEGDFDVDILLELSWQTNPVLRMDSIKGFVTAQLTSLPDVADMESNESDDDEYDDEEYDDDEYDDEYDDDDDEYDDDEYDDYDDDDEESEEYVDNDWKWDYLVDDNNYLSAWKMISFMQSLLDRTLNRIPNRTIIIKDQAYKILKIQNFRNSPALTLTILFVNSDFEIEMDFVPCFVLPLTALPKRGFSGNPLATYPDEFFIVPKTPGISDPGRYRYFGVSLQKEEHKIFYDWDNLKPTIRMMKCFKQELEINVSSYIIKTLFLWQIYENEDPDKLFRSSLSYCLMHMLKRFYVGLKRKRIEDFWNPDYNLLSYFPNEAIEEFTEKIAELILDIECDPSSETIYKYLLN